MPPCQVAEPTGLLSQAGGSALSEDYSASREDDVQPPRDLRALCSAGRRVVRRNGAISLALMSEQTETAAKNEQVGDSTPASKIPSIRRPNVRQRITGRRQTTHARERTGSRHPPSNGADLTSEPTLADNGGQGGTASTAATPGRDDDMARKPEAPAPPPSYYKLIDDDPTVPKPDAVIGPPEEVGEPKPFADLSKPEDFPDDVRAVIESAPK
jgi:hypothetical protein